MLMLKCLFLCDESPNSVLGSVIDPPVLGSVLYAGCPASFNSAIVTGSTSSYNV